MNILKIYKGWKLVETPELRETQGTHYALMREGCDTVHKEPMSECPVCKGYPPEAVLKHFMDIVFLIDPILNYNHHS